MDDHKLQLYLLGKPRIVLAGELQSDLLLKAQGLLFYLALQRRSHSRTALAGLMWSEMPDANARANLRTALSRLRPQFREFLTVTRSEVSWAEGCDAWVDVVAFEKGLRGAAAQSQRTALAWYRGDLLTDFHLKDAPVFEEWLLVEQLRLRQLALDGLDRLAHDAWQRGELAQSLTDFRRLLALDSYRESAHRGVMRVLMEMGNRAGALAQYMRCQSVLATELGVEPAPSTVKLYEEIKRSDVEVPQKHFQESVSTITHNLPAETTSFHGRSRELTHIEGALQEEGCRLLVLTGLGGVGKTRLALAAAQQLLRDQPTWFPDGIFWVGLTAVSTVSALLTTIADALDFRFSGSADGQTQLFSFLSQKRMLLILDNLEQLIDIAPVLSDLLQAAPHVKLLATSREKLNLYEEWRLQIDGLSYPGDISDELDKYEAVQLFTQRARRVNMNFKWQEQASDLVRLCQLLEGLPLGLELAAAWVHVFSLRDIGEAVVKNQADLAVDWQNVPTRHHSLVAVFAYSWQLLSSEEQRVLAHLAVFHQGFTIMAATEVGDASPRLLAGLADKSLVRKQAHGRYDIHEQLRQFAWEKLSDLHKEQVEKRHMVFFASHLAEREKAVIGKDQNQFLYTLRRDEENMRLAWKTAVTSRAIDALGQMAPTLYMFYTKNGRQRDGFEQFGLVVDMLKNDAHSLTEAEEKLLAACLVFQGRCGEFIHDGFAEPERLLKEGLSLTRQHQLPVEMAMATLGLGQLALIQNNQAESMALLQESLSLCDEWHLSWIRPQALHVLGWIFSMQGELNQAKRMAEQAIVLQQENGDLNGEASALTTLGKIESDFEAYDRAEEAYGRAWQICRETGHRVGEAQALTGLFVACMRQEKVETAVHYAEKSLQVNQDAGNRLGMGIAYHNLGYACAAQENHKQAVQYYRQALAIYEMIGGNQQRIENTKRYLAESLEAI